MSNVQVVCAGCSQKHDLSKTIFYRNKRWCQEDKCKDIIDLKIKHKNFIKAKKKKDKGTFRHGVPAELREFVKNRDGFTCRNCFIKNDSLALQVHHIVPVSNGGTDDLSNLILLCYDCHTSVHKTGWESFLPKFTEYTKNIMV